MPTIPMVIAVFIRIVAAAPHCWRNHLLESLMLKLKNSNEILNHVTLELY